MYISLWENSRGHPDNVSFMQFSTKIDGFEQKDSQGFENSYNSYEQYPLEKFFIFTIYQNYTLALMQNFIELYELVMRNALLTVCSEMLPFSGNNQNIKLFRVPPEHFAIGYVHNDNLPLGNIALQYVIQNNCRKVWWCFLMISCTF